MISKLLDKTIAYIIEIIGSNSHLPVTAPKREFKFIQLPLCSKCNIYRKIKSMSICHKCGMRALGKDHGITS